ncbi:uncharacterized protein ACJ7VT_006802 [Polymixia lowei]
MECGARAKIVKLNQKFHITVQRGEEGPALQRCSECCKMFHCPFCKPSVFRPTVLSKAQKHLRAHKRRAVCHKDYTIYKCNLQCSTRAHFHCVSCTSLFDKRKRFLDHLVACEGRMEGRAEAQTLPEDIIIETNAVSEEGPHLPLSSLRLLAPPVWLTAAWMWQVAQQRQVEQYGKLVQFVGLVTEAVPQLLSGRHAAQLVLGLRARLILELVKSGCPFDRQSIQDHLNGVKLWTTNSTVAQEKGQQEQVDISKSRFLELVQTLLNDPSKRKHFFKDIYPVRYGRGFDTSLDGLLWEFFSRLEDFLPVPRFSQLASSPSVAALDFDPSEQVVSNAEDLRILLQHHKQQEKLAKSQFSLRLDTILNTLASQLTSEDCRDQHEHTVKNETGVEAQRKAQRSPDQNEQTTERQMSQTEGSAATAHCPVEQDEDTDDGSKKTVGSDCQQIQDEKQQQQQPKEEDQEEQQSSCSPEAAENETPAAAEEKVRVHDTTKDVDVGSVGNVADDRPVSSGAPKSCGGAWKQTCLECGKIFRFSSGLRRHQAVHSTEQRFHCTQCDKKYKNKYSLSKHLDIHTDRKPYVCSYCGRAFRLSQSFNRHQRSHTGERPFACTVCNKRFIDKPGLKVHLRVHKGEKPYLCSECGKSFSNSGTYLVHSRLHTGDRPHHCDICGKDFVALHLLKVHLRYHTGERPYPCTVCQKSFHCSYTLKSHTRIHTGDKPYQCVICDKRFTGRGGLKVHERTHS